MIKKRKCKDCSRSITYSHGKAIYCKDCSYKRQLANARAWWKKHKYSEVVAEKRDKAKFGY